MKFKSVRKAQRKLTPTEFMRWRLYLINEDKEQQRSEWYDYHREDYYLAKIAYEVYLLRFVVQNLGKTGAIKPELTFKQFFLDLRKKRMTADQRIEKEQKKEQFLKDKKDLAMGGWLALVNASRMK